MKEIKRDDERLRVRASASSVAHTHMHETAVKQPQNDRCNVVCLNMLIESLIRHYTIVVTLLGADVPSLCGVTNAKYIRNTPQTKTGSAPVLTQSKDCLPICVRIRDHERSRSVSRGRERHRERAGFG